MGYNMEQNRNKECWATACVNPEVGEFLVDGQHLHTWASINLERLTGQKLLEADGDVPIAIIIVALKHIRHALETNTRLHEEIEAHAIQMGALRRANVAGLALKRLEEDGDKRRAEPVPERDQRILKLAQIDAPAAVIVEAIKQLAPRSEVPPQRDELVEVDLPDAVAVEHADHHFDRPRVERRVVAIHEGGAQLGFGQDARMRGIGGAEEWEELLRVVGGHG